MTPATSQYNASSLLPASCQGFRQSSRQSAELSIYSGSSQEGVARASEKIQGLFRKLDSLHQSYKKCMTNPRDALWSPFSDSFLLTKDKRTKRHELESLFLTLIENEVKPVVRSKKQGYLSLIEKVCHIAAEMMRSISQDSKDLKNRCDVFKDTPYKYKTSATTNQIQSEHAQLTDRLAKAKHLAAVLGQREFDRKYPSQQKAIEEIERNLNGSSVPSSWAFQSIGAAANKVGNSIASLFSRSTVKPTPSSVGANTPAQETMEERMRRVAATDDQLRRSREITLQYDRLVTNRLVWGAAGYN